MQRPFLTEPAHDLLIIRRKLYDLYVWKQSQTALGRKQIFRSFGIASRDLLLIVAASQAMPLRIPPMR